MQLAMLGLGRMGGNMVQRLLAGGHKVIAYDVDPRRATELAAFGATPATTLDEVIAALSPPRVCWTMVPAGKITRSLGVNVGQVYLAKHRVSRLLKQEVKKLERQMGP